MTDTTVLEDLEDISKRVDAAIAKYKEHMSPSMKGGFYYKCAKCQVVVRISMDPDIEHSSALRPDVYLRIVYEMFSGSHSHYCDLVVEEGYTTCYPIDPKEGEYVASEYVRVAWPKGQ